MGDLILPLIALVGTMIFSRSITGKAMKFLSEDQKEKLTEMFKSQRKTGMIAVLAIIGLYFAIVSLELLTPAAYTSIYVAIVVIFIGIQGILARKKLKEKEFPEEFVKAHTHSTVFRALGVILFIVLLITN